jgi:hypothetical protein
VNRIGAARLIPESTESRTVLPRWSLIGGAKGAQQ